MADQFTCDEFGDTDLFSVFDSPDTNVDPKQIKKKKKKTKADKEPESKPALSSSELVDVVTGGKHTLEDDEDSDEEAKKKLKSSALLEDVQLEDYALRIQIHTLESVEACTHEVAVPHDVAYVPLKAPTTKPAKEYQFLLDPFQKEAILCLENNQSVLVSAHTSAGKTVVAEYAIAMSLRDSQRVVYTTPIKALSNQKYREMYEEFKDVGLMTGDVTINPTASCLIMTTEILRSMLYRGSEVMREVAWVVFDEIHYMRDKARGVVWEESIILLPDNVHYVFLSATIPNARQFAEWISHLHKQPCHVVYTEFRPVPLQHYIFPAGGDGLHLVVDENGNFKEDNFTTAMSVLQNVGDASKGDQKGRKGGFKGGESNCLKIVRMIMERNFAPVIVFSFSKKECEAYALDMAKLDFLSNDQKSLVEEVFNNAMDVLSDEDKQLPQVIHVLPLLKRGIGVHHSGLLPILKETIEILFSEGLIKALFATETFAMGLNMPAKTVLFTNVRKFDGKDFRWVTSGEYIQMSGRAGRRGIDDRGIVILMVDEKMSPAVGRSLVKGQADPINSAFHLTYNMVLNLLRVEDVNPEYMLERSFFQFQNYAAIPELIDKVQKLQNDQDALLVNREADIATYFKIQQQLNTLATDFQVFITKPQYIVPFLQPGRLIQVKNSVADFGWGVVINFKKRTGKAKENPLKGENIFTVEVLLHLSKGSSKANVTSAIQPCPAGEKGEMQVVPIHLQLISQISSVRVYYPQDLRPLDNRMSVLNSIQEVKKRFPKGVPLLDPIEDMGIKDTAFREIVQKIESFEHRLYSHSLHKDPNLEMLLTAYQKKMLVSNELKLAKQELKKTRSLLHMDELKCRKRVLRRLGYCSMSDVIELKGRVACEISSADELLVTEMLFNGLFNDLSAQQATALLSCFAFEEKSSKMPVLTDELSGPLHHMQDIARRIAKVSNEARLTLNEDEYVESFKPYMMDAVYSWCNGASFLQICKMTDVYEGSIIRGMRRLEEMLRQMCQASKAIGNTELENKFAEGIKRIKRDIVFAASLYL